MPTSSDQAQVVVWGGGTGGVAAALQAARSGADTLLLTPGSWLGGMVSAAGVCAPDGNELTPWQTGLWGAFLRALQRREPDGLDHNWVSCFGYRPATAEAILREWVAAAPRLRWWPEVALQGVRRRGKRLTGVELLHQGELVQVALQILIDGSDRGDSFPLAEAPCRLGWEAREQWGEPSAPSAESLRNDPFFQRQPVQSPTWVVMGQLTADRPSQPLPAQALLPEPFTAAPERFGLERTISYGRLPGGLVMLNWPLHGNDWHGDLARAFSPEPSVGAALADAMRAHSLRFATALEEASGGWLRQATCFPDRQAAAGGALEGRESLALMPYWREGRRLVGQELVLEQQLLPQGSGASIASLPRDGEGRLTSIAVGNYANDHHYPGPDWPLAPKSCRWGGRWSGTPFTIPYGALVSAELENLLAADKGFSTSHMANGATRLQPLIFNVGQAAGAAAALAVARDLPPVELPVRELQELLLRDPLAPAGPVPLWDTPWHHPDWAARQRAVLDDPSRISVSGELAGLRVHPSPPEPHEQLWSGELSPDGQGGYQLAGAGQRWPVITLEPALHLWLQDLDRPRSVRLMGCLNPWGPWLRVSRLAD